MMKITLIAALAALALSGCGQGAWPPEYMKKTQYLMTKVCFDGVTYIKFSFSSSVVVQVDQSGRPVSCIE